MINLYAAWWRFDKPSKRENRLVWIGTKEIDPIEFAPNTRISELWNDNLPHYGELRVSERIAERNYILVEVDLPIKKSRLTETLRRFLDALQAECA